ncbi:hypothetical protein, partial [Klebsiella pneumoniae]|uniref:hypothetical protein n=1 Tax=Klebsiella pneumoniae TaxID=573 RepID=UPI001C6F7594
SITIQSPDISVLLQDYSALRDAIMSKISSSLTSMQPWSQADNLTNDAGGTVVPGWKPKQ